MYTVSLHYTLINHGASRYLPGGFLMPPDKKNLGMENYLDGLSHLKKKQQHQGMDSPSIELLMAAGQAPYSK
jgi:hypothetical protein